MFDEAFRGLSSKASQSKVNKAIVQALMEVGQKNLIVFIVLPTFFLLEIYAAVLRSNCLFHIYKSKDPEKKWRAFRIYNYGQKSLLWNVGRKKGFSYKFPRVKIRGKFYNKYPIDEMSYRKKKELSFGKVEVTKREGESNNIAQRNHLLVINYYKIKEYQPTLTKSDYFRWLVASGSDISYNELQQSLLKYEKEMLEKGIDMKKKFHKPKLNKMSAEYILSHGYNNNPLLIESESPRKQALEPKIA